MTTAAALEDVAGRIAARLSVTRQDVETIFACTDLVAVGAVGEQARQVGTGSRVTFGRVLELTGALPEEAQRAGEVRLVAVPSSLEEARRRAGEVVAWAAGRRVTAFELADLVTLAEGDLDVLAEVAGALRREGLEALASVAIDRATSDAALIAQVDAVLSGGLGAWRATVERADGLEQRAALIERACVLQEATRAVRAFAPLPRLDSIEAPSTGYDDVRTIAAARVRCRDIERIQVDWGLYGPKLAQVAIAFGANDIDGVSPEDSTVLGPRRSPLEDIQRQIRAAGGDPVERDGSYAAE